MCSWGRPDNVEYTNYVDKTRWISFYHQIDEILKTNPSSILEIGSGMGILNLVLKQIFGIKYESLDNDSSLKTDHIGSVLNLPFSDKTYDVVCCFQVLEHLPFSDFDKAFSEICRTAKKAVVISLPNSKNMIRFHISLKNINIILRRWFSTKKMSKNHYWEISQKGYDEKMIRQKIIEIASRYNFNLVNEFRVVENVYHHFFILYSSNSEDIR